MYPQLVPKLLIALISSGIDVCDVLINNSRTSAYNANLHSHAHVQYQKSPYYVSLHMPMVPNINQISVEKGQPVALSFSKISGFEKIPFVLTCDLGGV